VGTTWPKCGQLKIQYTECKMNIYMSHDVSNFGRMFVYTSGGNALEAESSRVRFPTVALRFVIDIILLAALWPLGLVSL